MAVASALGFPVRFVPVKETKQEWGRNVKLFRQTLGADGKLRPSADVPAMSQADLARLCNVTQQTISAIEKGTTAPRDSLKVTIATVLGQDVRVLFPLTRSAAA